MTRPCSRGNPARSGPWGGSEWLFELKHDDFRAARHKAGREVSLTSRNRRPLVVAFPDIALGLNADGVFDGELCRIKAASPIGTSYAEGLG